MVGGGVEEAWLCVGRGKDEKRDGERVDMDFVKVNGEGEDEVRFSAHAHSALHLRSTKYQRSFVPPLLASVLKLYYYYYYYCFRAQTVRWKRCHLLYEATQLHSAVSGSWLLTSCHFISFPVLPLPRVAQSHTKQITLRVVQIAMIQNGRLSLTHQPINAS